MKKMALIVLIFLLFTFHLTAQSSFLQTGQNGPGITTSFLIGEQTLLRIGGNVGFSIGGKMDIGMLIENGPEDPTDVDQRFVDFGITYGYLILKQDETIPISLGIFGMYGISNIMSDTLTIRREQKNGTGWTAGTRLYYDITISPMFTWRIGGEYEYRAYRYTTVDMDDPEGVVSPSTVDRLQQHHYGVIADAIMTLPNWPVLSLGVAALLNEDLEISFKPILKFAQSLR